MTGSIDSWIQKFNESAAKKTTPAGEVEERDFSNGWLVFRPEKGPRVVCSYLRLDDWEYDHEEKTGCITFYFSRGLTVTVTGEDLESYVMKLLLRTLRAIEVTDPKEHKPGAPFVKHIAVDKPKIESPPKPKPPRTRTERIPELAEGDLAGRWEE